MLPSIFGENLLDEWLDFPFGSNFFSGKNPLYDKSSEIIMQTDVRETEKSYELDVELPGYKKENIKLSCRDGYLTISADKGLEKDEKDKEGKYIRQERYRGACSRTFYVGNVAENQIGAKFENGILKISIPKEQQAKKEENKYISIEG